MEYHDRKHPRLKNYDYSQNGFYFVTICTKNKSCILGRVGAAPDGWIPPVYLTESGKIVKKYIDRIETVYPGAVVDQCVIMPNHIHLILVLSDPNTDGGLGAGRPTVQRIIRGVKALTSREVGHPIWQSSFYEHVIRNEQSYAEICNYIFGNPRKWTERSQQ